MKVACPTCKGTKKIDLGGQKLNCNVCDDGNGNPTGFVDDGRTPEDGPEPEPTINEQRAERDLEPLPPPVSPTTGAPTVQLGRFIVIDAACRLKKAGDDNTIFEGLEGSSEEQYVYQRIATVKPRTGADIVKEDLAE